MRLYSFSILIAITSVAAVEHVADATPARFWLSTSSSSPSVGEVPTLVALAGDTQQVHIWAQPATVSSGPYHPVVNPFKTLQNLSLNIVADSPAISFLDSSITVHNPPLNSVTRRFEFTHDAATGLNAMSCDAGVIGVCGLQGFSISPTGSFAGLGPVCDPNDPFCGATANGSPVWLFGSVDYEVLQMDVEANLHLQIGNNGINHAGESSLSTEVVFGTDSAAIYRAGIDTDADGLVDNHDRNVTLLGDSPDLIITTGSVTLPGDYNGNGKVEQADIDLVLLNWGKNASLVPGNWASVVVDQDELDRVLLHWGEMAGSAESAGAAVPEPSNLLSALALMALLVIAARLRRSARVSTCAGA